MTFDPHEKLTEAEIVASHARFQDALCLQEIEGNPLDAEQIAMFEMFERERWSHDRCTEYLLARAREAAASPANKA